MKSPVIDISMAILGCPHLNGLHDVRGVPAIEGQGLNNASHIFVDGPDTLFCLGGWVMAIVSAPQSTNAARHGTMVNKPVV